MNVVVMIQGREAIPVRTIPLLTDWETMSPDVVAHVLAWDEEHIGFPGLQAFHVDNLQRPISATWWENIACRQLKALTDSITAVEVTHETGMQDWRRRSLEILPAGVFVWKDEFEPPHRRRYGPDGEIAERNSRVLSEEEQARRVALNFEPFIPDANIRRLVMMGFESVRETSKAMSPSRHDEIVLPAGTERINVIDIPALIAAVLYSQQLAAGAPPDGAQELPDDCDERTWDVQFYRLAQEETPKVKHAIEAGTLVAFSKLTKSRCGIDDIENAYVKVDAFTAFVAQTYDGLHVRMAEAQTQGTTPRPAPARTARAASIIHSTKARRNTLTPVIELAKKQCHNPQDTAEVWATLLVLAEKKHPPLIGATEQGLQYLNHGSVAIFKRKSLGQRLAR